MEKTAQLTQAIRYALMRINHMPPRRRRILRLLIAGHTYLEIADRFNISPNTVRNHLRVARQRLRKSLPEVAEYAATL